MKPFRRIFSLFHREKLDAEMAEEMRQHLEAQTRRNVQAGMSLQDAHAAAQRSFGNVASIQQQARERRRGAKLELLLRDLNFAGRSLRRSPGFAVTVVVSLALGIGMATAVYSVAHALLFSPLRYGAADELVAVQAWHKERGASDVAPATFGEIAATNKSFESVAAQYYYYVNLTGRAVPVLLNSGDVTRDFSRTFRVDAWRGRTLLADDFRPGAAPVAVLSYAVWQELFGADERVIGTQVSLDDVSHTIVGIMPPSFKDPTETAQLWRPMLAGRDNLTDHGSRYWTMFGRRRNGVTLEQANAELAAMTERLKRNFPQFYENWMLKAVDLRGLIVAGHRQGLLVLLAAAGCLLAITAANVTALSILRILARRRELAVRIALGSSLGRVVRLLTIENLFLTAAGGFGGVVIAMWGVPALLASLPEGWLPRASEVAMNLPVLLAGVALALACGLVTGAVSGFLLSRVQANDVLKEGTRGATGPVAGRLRTGLIIAEIALAIVLLAGAGLLGRSFAGLLQRRAGLDAARLLAVTISQSGKRYDSP
ncbi:MAG TPA: ABC transporter permease, partial [Candidatus Didemnitutus sp.]|nr:ABC transporter permease [Candidatus Didemnitutus sp.]